MFRGLTGSQRTPGFWGVTIIIIIIIFKTSMLQNERFDSMLKAKISNFIDKSLKISITKLVIKKN